MEEFILKKTEEGYTITNDEVKSASRILGYVGLAMLATRVFRVLLWPPAGGK